MFGILRWWRERQRKIFRFFSGIEHCSADPLHVWMLLQTDSALEMPRHIGEMESEDERVSAEAGLIVSAATRRAFGLAAFQDGGPTDEECIGTLVAYLRWLEAQKKSISSSLTSRQPTDSFRPVCPLTTT